VEKNRKAIVFVNNDLCKGTDNCGLCIHVCPADVFDKSEKLTGRGVRPPVPVRTDLCTGCRACMIYCPDFAIVVESEGENQGD